MLYENQLGYRDWIPSIKLACKQKNYTACYLIWDVHKVSVR